jgi:predicted protein tyrosine phosphatase
MNILFVCSANKDRSKTAEDYFSAKYKDINFDSAGTNLKICHQLGTNYIEEHQLEWADTVYVMETKHFSIIKSLYGNSFNTKTTVLMVKDYYKYYDSELIKILLEKVNF